MARHELTEVEVPEPDPALPAARQTLQSWVRELRKGRDVKLYVDKGTERWLILRDRGTGLFSYARVEGIIRFMLDEVRAGSEFAGPGGARDERTAQRFRDWMATQLAKTRRER